MTILIVDLLKMVHIGIADKSQLTVILRILYYPVGIVHESSSVIKTRKLIGFGNLIEHGVDIHELFQRSLEFTSCLVLRIEDYKRSYSDRKLLGYGRYDRYVGTLCLGNQNSVYVITDKNGCCDQGMSCFRRNVIIFEDLLRTHELLFLIDFIRAVFITIDLEKDRIRTSPVCLGTGFAAALEEIEIHPGYAHSRDAGKKGLV